MKRKIYIIILNLGYDGKIIEKIFSSKEKALKFIEKNKERYKKFWSGKLEIKIHEIN